MQESRSLNRALAEILELRQENEAQRQESEATRAKVAELESEIKDYASRFGPLVMRDDTDTVFGVEDTGIYGD